MNKAKTLSLSLVASVLLGSVALAAAPSSVAVPRNQMGSEAQPLNAGYSETRDSAPGELVVCSGRCLLAAITMGTGPVTSAVELRNTSVPDGTGALVMIRRFEVAQSGYSQSNMVPLPILLDKGISVKLPAASNGEEVTVLYRDMD